MTFLLATLSRQHRRSGAASRLQSPDAYYQVRPLGSRPVHWASPQSRVISGRGELEDCSRPPEQRFSDTQPIAQTLGGYRFLPPERIELWQGRASRLHDRLTGCKTPTDLNVWHLGRLPSEITCALRLSHIGRSLRLIFSA